MKSCEWNGKTYESLSEAAKELGITRERMRQRVDAGFVCDEDMRRVGVKVSCVWNNMDFSSISDAARSRNVGISTMYRWLKKGYVCDADVEAAKK